MTQTFADRVGHAARVICSGRRRGFSRSFDRCFESYDGDAVVVALLRRAESNERLRSNIWYVLDREKAEALAARHAGRKMADLSRELIRTAEVEFEKVKARWEAESAARIESLNRKSAGAVTIDMPATTPAGDAARALEDVLFAEFCGRVDEAGKATLARRAALQAIDRKIRPGAPNYAVSQRALTRLVKREASRPVLCGAGPSWRPQ